jgi:secreted trypsin-like serine protease
MRSPRFATLLLGFLIVAGILPLTFGQSTSDKQVLPAPTTENRAVPRSEAQSEPHHYTNRIVGGKLSAGRPFMAALLYEKEGKLFQYCGASVIGDRWLLTAAHCEVRVGEVAIINRSNLGSAGGTVLKVDNVYPNPQYDSTTHDNDIALLYLSGEISSLISQISVAVAPPPNTRVLAAGWGLTSENGKQSLLLREVEVPIVTSTTCKAKYSDLTPNMVCAGEAGKDSCQGDSGGPLFLVIDKVVQQFGIVSNGVGCGRKGWPGVYTDVNAYRPWITKTMKREDK